MKTKRSVSFLASPERIETVYGQDMINRVSELCAVNAYSIADTDPETVQAALAGSEIVLSTWGMPRMSKDILDAAPELKIIT